MSDIKTLLRGTSLLGDFPDRDLELLAKMARRRSCPAGEVLFVELSEGDEFFVIEKGEAQVDIVLSRDSEPIVMQAGELIGEVSFVGNGQRSATVTAKTELDLLVWDNTELRALCEQETGLGYRLSLAIAQTLAQRLKRWNERLLDQVQWGF